MATSKKKSILGDGGGLGALFADQGLDTSVSNEDAVRELSVTSIVANPFQPRHILMLKLYRT
ncbi:Uncharacterised protein [Weissella viridescens]|uniref:Uncharacterized protein n=1 Tax=Weissella viridescens TaxID=1629 RepID=A0A380NXM7_WEIVI|nr:Uncharacterised protein [Weissella viridescens]